MMVDNENSDDNFLNMQIENVNINPRPWKIYTKCSLSFLLQIFLYSIGTASFAIAANEPAIDNLVKVLFTFSSMIIFSTSFIIENAKMIKLHDAWRTSCWPYIMYALIFSMMCLLLIFGTSVINETDSLNHQTLIIEIMWYIIFIGIPTVVISLFVLHQCQ